MGLNLKKIFSGHNKAVICDIVDDDLPLNPIQNTIQTSMQDLLESKIMAIDSHDEETKDELSLFDKNHNDRETTVPAAQDINHKDVHEQSNITKTDNISRLQINDFIKFVEIIQEFDSYRNRTENSQVKAMIELMECRIIEALISLGAQPIDNDVVFNNEHHIPRPLIVTKNGQPIKSFLRRGLIFNDSVVLKALVDLILPSSSFSTTAYLYEVIYSLVSIFSFNLFLNILPLS